LCYAIAPCQNCDRYNNILPFTETGDRMDKEPEIGLGGANFNADPIGARELLYPIAVVLSGDRLSQYEALQKKLGLYDRDILLTYHPCFTATAYGGSRNI
jgi:hypothetical protein